MYTQALDYRTDIPLHLTPVVPRLKKYKIGNCLSVDLTHNSSKPVADIVSWECSKILYNIYVVVANTV
jgi:hypothetical protein